MEEQFPESLKQLNTIHFTIARIENFAGGGINVLLKLLNFYSDFFVVEHILSQKFEVVQISDTIGPLESVAVVRLGSGKKSLMRRLR